MPPNQPMQPVQPKVHHFLLTIVLIILAVLLVAGAGGGVYEWQQGKVQDLRTQVAALQKNQLPTKQFSNYNTCATNGGVDLNTVNGEFNACLESGKQVILQYSAQNLPRINQDGTTKTANEVKYTGKYSSDLIQFLTYDDQGCGTARGYYKIVKEVPERFALVDGGCTNDPHALAGDYDTIAMKLGGGWALVSPTNNFNANGVPSCLMVDMLKISKNLTPQCFQNTGYNDGSLRAVTNS